MTLAWFLLSFYMRENCTGPSVYTQYVEETRAPLVKGGPLPSNDLDCMSNKNLQLQAALLKNFERDGERDRRSACKCCRHSGDHAGDNG